MRSSSVVIRLFVLTTVIFIAFVTIAFVIQLKSFEAYYFDLKTRDIDDQYESFIKLYEDSKWNQNLLDQNVRTFESRSGLKMALVDNHYGIINEEKYKIFILDAKGQVYEVQLNDVFRNEDYMALDIHRGDQIDVYGYFWGTDLRNISLMQMMLNDEMIFDGVDAKMKGKLSLDHVSGTVLSTKLPDEDDLIYGIADNGISAVVDTYYFNPSALNINVKNSFIFTDVLSGRKYIVKVFDIGDNQVKSVVMMTDQQPIIEAAIALRSFYPALITGVFIVGAIMMFFMTLSIANPLYEIKRKAEKLVMLDFTDYLEIKHNDEIGSLSRSLNHLSYNLECAITELNEANDKLKSDMAKDREIEHMRKELIRNVSHDFKTPLGIIKAFTEGLEDGLLEGDISYYSGVILEEVETLEGLVSDMLELSKLQTGAYKLEIEEFPMNAMVENILLKNQPLAEQKHLGIRFKAADYDVVFGDYRKLARAVQNFISNAILYGEEGTTVEIALKNVDRKLRFEIFNHCLPIPEDQMDMLWTKFHRLDSARTKSGGGSGLGLAIAKEILDQHHCEYGVENTEGGVIFYFEMDKYVNHIV